MNLHLLLFFSAGDMLMKICRVTVPLNYSKSNISFLFMLHSKQINQHLNRNFSCLIETQQFSNRYIQSLAKNRLQAQRNTCFQHMNDTIQHSNELDVKQHGLRHSSQDGLQSYIHVFVLALLWRLMWRCYLFLCGPGVQFSQKVRPSCKV